MFPSLANTEILLSQHVHEETRSVFADIDLALTNQD